MSAIAQDFVSYSRVFNFVYSLAGVASLGFALLVETYAQTTAVFAANALTFMVSFGSLLQVKYRQDYGVAEQAGIGQWIEGFRLFARHRIILTTCGLVVLVDFFTGVLYEMFPHKAALLGWDKAGTYIFYFLVCLGNTIGALFVRPDMWRTRTLGLLCTVGAGSASMFFVSDSWSPLLVTCLCFFSVQIMAIVSAEIVIQRIIPVECQGRVFAISESFPYLALSLGSAAGGSLGGPALAALCVASFVVFFLLGRTGDGREFARAST
jgi:hypothetical protein